MAGEFTRETNLFGVDFGDCGVLFRDANRRVDDVDDVGVYGDLRFVRRVNAERAFEENRRVESRERRLSRRWCTKREVVAVLVTLGGDGGGRKVAGTNSSKKGTTAHH